MTNAPESPVTEDMIASLPLELQEQAHKLNEMWGEEDLHPDLVPHLYETDWIGTVLKHPLVFSVPHAPHLNKRINQQYVYKVDACKRAKEEGNWDTYVFLHERPYRVDAFKELADADLMTDAEYWKLFGSLWMDSENIRENPDEWEALLARRMSSSSYAMMDDDEVTELHKLPDLITVYQGHTDARDDGWSWTTDQEKAEWFARRFSTLEGGSPMVAVGNVRKSDVVAYLLRRGESEIIAAPQHVAIDSIYELDGDDE